MFVLARAEKFSAVGSNRETTLEISLSSDGGPVVNFSTVVAVR